MSKGFKKEASIIKKEITKTDNTLETEIEFTRKSKLKLLFIQGAFFSFASALLSYVLSSYLSNFIQDKYVSVIYLISNTICFLLVFYFGKIVKKIGLFRSVVFDMIILFLSLILQLIIKQNIFTIASTIVLYQVTSSLVYVFIDYYVEKYSLDGSTGDTKGLQWTIMNLTFLFGPLSAGFLLEKFGFSFLFILSILFTIPTFVIFIRHFKHIKITATKTVNIKLKKIIKNNSVFRISMVSLILNIFYCWMSIYTPIYMNKTLGLSWDKIGIILAIILLPFVIFQYPAGKIADKYLGQKELLMTSIIVTGLSTIALFFTKDVITFTIALFCTRIGASILEVMRDVHFYKNTNSKSLDLMSFYKSMSSLAYIIGPIISSLILIFFNTKFLFLFLGVIIIVSGLIVTWGLKDTKINFKTKFFEM